MEDKNVFALLACFTLNSRGSKKVGAGFMEVTFANH